MLYPSVGDVVSFQDRQWKVIMCEICEEDRKVWLGLSLLERTAEDTQPFMSVELSFDDFETITKQ